MKTLKSILLLLLATIAMQAQDVNKLFVPDITGAEGSTITLPVSLSNTGMDIVAMQFELTVPQEAITLDVTAISLTGRKEDHTVAGSSLGNGRYRIMVYSPSNKPFKANSGEILGIQAKIADAVDRESTFPLVLSEVVLSDSKGNNIATAPANGTFRIKPSPDFIVSDVQVSAAAVMPGSTIDVSYVVSNIGNITSTGGWSERISLVSSEGDEKSLGTFYSDVPMLSVGETASRSVKIELPTLPGIDGGVNVRVEIVPNSDSGEETAYQKNNTAETSGYTVNVGKLLLMELPTSAVVEGESSTVRCRLSRSGSWNKAQTFALAKVTGDSRLAVPETVTISQGKSSAYFYMTLSDNDILDYDSTFCVQASGNGYEPVSETLVVEDDELPQLTLQASRDNIVEGEAFQLTITAERASSAPIVVSIVSEAPKRFNHPATVTIPTGETTATVNVATIDNEEVELQAGITFKASAEKHQSGECVIILDDNDLPAIELELSPVSVNESAGLVAIMAKLRRTTNTDKKVTIQLSDDSEGDIYYPTRSIVLEKGVEEMQFSLGIVDNAVVDGDRMVSVTAAVYVSSCNCSASGTNVGAVTKTIEIIDNDGPSLGLSSSKTTLLEGNESGIALVITRNTSTDKALAVSISSDYDDGLSYEHNVTIPAGKTSVEVPVKALANSASGDDRTIVFTVEAADFSKGTCWVMLTDQTLPDVQISDITLSQTEAEVGRSVEVSVTIYNGGAATLPEATKIGLYISNSTAPVNYFYTQQPLAVGEQAVLSKTVTLPASVGCHEIYAVANDGQAVKELLYANNTSKKVAVKTTAPFSATVSADKAICQQGEAVQLNGRATGNAAANAKIEVYVINDGLRQTIEAVTDDDGYFTASYQPYSSQMGHFVAGACYPGEDLTEEMTAFDIYGFKLASNSAITCDILLGETRNGSITLSNPGELPLTGVKATVLSKPEGCNVTATVADIIPGESNVSVNYSLKGGNLSSGNAWEQVKLLIETAEGPSLTTTLYYYCRNPKGQLEASVPNINTTMVKGASREYPFFITNVGKGETGKITLTLPEWMSTATPREMPSLAQGDTATVILRLTPTETMQLNVPVTGKIGVNCENGDGIPLSYSIEPVSEATGTLTVDVCDEYTYYTAEGQHVAGAQVTVKHPSTGAVVAKGQTDETGRYTVSLPEGYYRISVTADNHDSYSNNLLVDPGKTTVETVSLSISSVKITYTIEETEIEDQYKVVTTYTYETNVPAPVVAVTQSGEVNGDNLADGESTIVNLVFTNKGLIAAENLTLCQPTFSEDWNLEYLVNTDSIRLAPQQSYVVPVKVTKVDMSAKASSRRATKASNTSPMSACMAGLEYYYQNNCGKILKTNKAAYKMALKTCAHSAVLNALMGAFGGGAGSGGGPGGYGPGSPNGDTDKKYTPDTNQATVEREALICDPDAAACADQIIGTLAGNYSGVGTFIGLINNVVDHCADAVVEGRKPGAAEAIESAEDALNAARDAIEEAQNGNKLSNTVGGLAEDLYDILTECYSFLLKQPSIHTKSKKKEYDALSTVDAYINQVLALDSLLFEYFGDDAWYNEYSDDKYAFFDYVKSLGYVSVYDIDQLMAYRPESVSKEQFSKFIERMNGTNPDNAVDWNKLSERCDLILQLEDDATALGYASMYDMYHQKLRDAYYDMSNPSGSVCSKVQLQLSQTMVMTRQAFRGTLTVSNGSDANAIKDIKLFLSVKDEEGNVATSHEFQVNLETLESFEGNMDLTGGWSLAPKATGVATIMFIPTKYAAEDVPQDYSFGGVLSYIDPYTGLEVSRELSAVTLTVKPSPNIDLTYFMQRDVLGDDPLTTDVVEPSRPAEFALLISNKGHGDATNVRMVTNQPEIVENEKGLLVDFELLSSQLNGKDHTLALGGSVATDFGTIPAQSTAYAQWWLQSSLLGHFTDYDVKATHITSYGNEDLSLLDNVTIHELIHGFTIDDGADPQTRGFLVNDIADTEDMPDMLYFSDGRQEAEVTKAAAINMTRRSDTEYVLTLAPSETGWNYGSANDLTAGKQKLVSVVRQSDGEAVPADNFWLTYRTLRDGKDPLYEYRLHAIADLTGEETFILTFEPKPEVELEVERFSGVPENGTVLTAPLTSVGVTFNKDIDAATFTTDDLTLTCQGKAVDVSQAILTKVDDAEYVIGFDGVTLESGYYVLTVQTSGITDSEGFTGFVGKDASWIQYADGTVTLTVTASPTEGGTVSPATGKVAYKSEVTLKAVPAEGYDFSGWMRGNETISDEMSFSYTATSDDAFTALFSIRHFNVDIEFDAACGTVVNAASGIYDYGTVLEMNALPHEGYEFVRWLVDEKELTTDESCSIAITDDVIVTAEFKKRPTTDLPANKRDRQGFKVHPLPLQNVMYVDGDFDFIDHLALVDMTGAVKVVKTRLQRGTPIDVSSLPKGIYVLKILTRDGMYVKKVYKQ